MIAVLDMVSLGYLVFFMWYKSTWREVTSNARRRFYMMIAILIVSFFDLFWALWRSNYPYLCNMLRPIVVIIYLSQTRNQMKNIFWYTFRDIFIVLLSIFMYITFFSLLMFFEFKYSMEGFNYFTKPDESIYQMIILMTTANFPDVMLPAYYQNRFYCIFFIIYLIFGLYFLQNILLAIVIENYKTRLQEKATDKVESRYETISKLFD